MDVPGTRTVPRGRAARGAGDGDEKEEAKYVTIGVYIGGRSSSLDFVNTHRCPSYFPDNDESRVARMFQLASTNLGP